MPGAGRGGQKGLLIYSNPFFLGAKRNDKQNKGIPAHGFLM